MRHSGAGLVAAWMVASVHFLEALGRHPCVDLSGAEIGVSEQDLKRSEVHSSIE